MIRRDMIGQDRVRDGMERAVGWRGVEDRKDEGEE